MQIHYAENKSDQAAVKHIVRPIHKNEKALTFTSIFGLGSGIRKCEKKKKKCKESTVQ